MSLRYREGDLRRPWTPRAPDPRQHAVRGGKAAEMARVAWAHLSKATTRNSPAARLAIETMEQAERMSSSHGASIETMLAVADSGVRLRKALKELP